MICIHILIIIITNHSNNVNIKTNEMKRNTVTDNKSQVAETIETIEIRQTKEIKTIPNTGTTTTTFDWYLVKYPTLILYALSGGLSITCYSGMILL